MTEMVRNKRRMMLILLALLGITLGLLLCNSSSAGTVGTPTIPLVPDLALFLSFIGVAAGLSKSRGS